MKYLTLDKSGTTPVACDSFEDWRDYMNTSDHLLVAYERQGESEITTVFDGHDTGDGTVWETVVSGGKLNGRRDRCAGTREHAEALHAKTVELVKESL